MGLKKKLALATGAFVSMSAASIATACPNELTSQKRLRRRRASVPARIAPNIDQSIRVNVQMPLNKARRVPASCKFYKIEVTLLDTQSGAVFHKIEEPLIPAGGGATLEFNLQEDLDDIGAATTVSANVEVTPTDTGACATINPIASFILVDNDNRRTFLPSRELEPVHLRPAALGGPIIIKDPK